MRDFARKFSHLKGTLLRVILLAPLSLPIGYLLRFDFNLPKLFWDRIHWNFLGILMTISAYLLVEALWKPLSSSLQFLSEKAQESLRISLSYLPMLFLSFLSGGTTLPRSVSVITWAVHLLINAFLLITNEYLQTMRQLRKNEEELVPALLIYDVPGEEEALKKMLLFKGYKVTQSFQVSEFLERLRRGDWKPSGKLILSKPFKEVLQSVNSPILILEVREGNPYLRKPSFEDLIGRRERNVPLEMVREALAGRKILITGCAGTVGGALMRKLLELKARGFQISQLIGLDFSEGGIFDLELSLRDFWRDLTGEDLPQDFLVLKLGDFRDEEFMRELSLSFKPDLVIHAGAYKHVPILQREPYQAIKNDLLATLDLLRIMDLHLSESDMIFISTDKAVNPLSNLGVVKRWGEIALLCSEGRGRRIIVRFGNVLGSSGSVLKVFQRSLEKGKPLPVTSEKAERYFMSLEEAGELILLTLAFEHKRGVFILNMGEPVKIIDLARKYLLLRGETIEGNIEIIGLRPGEKLREELLYDFEVAHEPQSPQLKGLLRIALYTEEEIRVLKRALGEAEKLLRNLSPENAPQVMRALSDLLLKTHDEVRNVRLS